MSGLNVCSLTYDAVPDATVIVRIKKGIPTTMHRDNSDRYEVQTAPSLAGHKRLGSYLVDAGLINRGQIEVALNDQKVTGMKFGEILVTRGWIKQQTIEYFMAKVVLPERKAIGEDTTTSPSSSSATPSTMPVRAGGGRTTTSPLNRTSTQKQQPNPSVRQTHQTTCQASSPSPSDGVSWVG